jgi:Resolvase, N terminal domain
MRTVNVKASVAPIGAESGQMRRRRGPQAEARAETVVTYSRVSTSEQALSGLGIDAQRATVAAYAERKELTIVGEYCDEGASAKSLKGRPAALAAHVAPCGGHDRTPILVGVSARHRAVTVDDLDARDHQDGDLAQVLGEIRRTVGHFALLAIARGVALEPIGDRERDATIKSHVRRYTSAIARRCSASVTTMKLQFCTLADVGARTAISRHSRIRPTGTGLVKSRRLRTERVVVSSASVDESTMG